MLEIELLQVDRQTATIRLAGHDLRLAVWYQPRDAGWYASVDLPPGNRIISGHRLASDVGLLGRLHTPLPGDIVCKPSGGQSLPLGRRPWDGRTHRLVYIE